MRESVAFGLGIGLSPLPILTMLLLLGSPRPRTNGVSFWLGWVAGVTIPTVALVVAVDYFDTTDGRSAAIAVAELLVGLLFLAVAANILARRSKRSPVPRWLEALDRSGPGRSATLAVVLSVCNPKNLALMLAGAVAITDADNVALATGAFLGVAVFAVSLALATYVARRDAAAPRISALRDGIVRHDRSIATVLGILIGGFFVLDGVRMF